MRMEQKQTVKEDGRHLIYYHFPETATSEETVVFNGIVAVDPLPKAEKNSSDESMPETDEASTVYSPPPVVTQVLTQEGGKDV